MAGLSCTVHKGTGTLYWLSGAQLHCARILDTAQSTCGAFVGVPGRPELLGFRLAPPGAEPEDFEPSGEEGDFLFKSLLVSLMALLESVFDLLSVSISSFCSFDVIVGTLASVLASSALGDSFLFLLAFAELALLAIGRRGRLGAAATFCLCSTRTSIVLWWFGTFILRGFFSCNLACCGFGGPVFFGW